MHRRTLGVIGAIGMTTACDRLPSEPLRVQHGPSSASSRSGSSPDEAPVTPITYVRRQILVAARINGIDAGLALIDTGATMCAMDRALADRIGIKADRTTEVHGTAGTITSAVGTMASLELGGRRVQQLDATVYPFTIPGPEGQTVGLIVGYPFLKHFAMDVDYGRRELRLHTAAIQCSASIPMTLPESIPTIRATLNGTVAAEFRIDTGASLFDTATVYLNITATVLDQLRGAGLDAPPVESFSGSGVGGPVELAVYQLDRLTLGSVTLEQPRAIVQPAQGIFADPDKPGFIANYTLESRKRVVIDYLDATLDFPEEPAP